MNDKTKEIRDLGNCIGAKSNAEFYEWLSANTTTDLSLQNICKTVETTAATAAKQYGVDCRVIITGDFSTASTALTARVYNEVGNTIVDTGFNAGLGNWVSHLINIMLDEVSTIEARISVACILLNAMYLTSRILILKDYARDICNTYGVKPIHFNLNSIHAVKFNESVLSTLYKNLYRRYVPGSISVAIDSRGQHTVISIIWRYEAETEYILFDKQDRRFMCSEEVLTVARRYVEKLILENGSDRSMRCLTSATVAFCIMDTIADLDALSNIARQDYETMHNDVMAMLTRR